ncbi:MAG TPA: arginase family protein [Trebonia sp.]
MAEPEIVPSMYGPDFTFAGVPRTALGALAEARHDVVIVGAPFDGGTSHRPGTRFGPQAIREPTTCRTTPPGRTWPSASTPCRSSTWPTSATW